MILVTSSIQSYIGKSKMHSAKKQLHPVMIEPETLQFLFWHILCYILLPSSLN